MCALVCVVEHTTRCLHFFSTNLPLFHVRDTSPTLTSPILTYLVCVSYSCAVYLLQWAGLVADFYGGRWNIFAAYIQNATRTGTPPDWDAYYNDILTFSRAWGAANNSYSVYPNGQSPTALAARMLSKYASGSVYDTVHDTDAGVAPPAVFFPVGGDNQVRVLFVMHPLRGIFLSFIRMCSCVASCDDFSELRCATASNSCLSRFLMPPSSPASNCRVMPRRRP